MVWSPHDRRRLEGQHLHGRSLQRRARAAVHSQLGNKTAEGRFRAEVDLTGDVGQDAWEEIDYEPRGTGGRNYGWRNREGAHNHVTSLAPAYQPLTDPIYEYNHSMGQSMTAGFVYRGSALPAAFRGRCFFADYVAGRIWSIALTVDSRGEAQASDLRDHTAELSFAGPLGNVSAFGVDSDGELYLVSHSRGVIHKIVPATAAPPTPSNLRIVRSQAGPAGRRPR